MPSTLCRCRCCYTTIVLSFIVWVMGGGIMGTEKPRCWDPHAEILRRRWYNNNKTKSIFAAIRTRVIHLYVYIHTLIYIYIPDCTHLYTHTCNRYATRKGDPNFGLLTYIIGVWIYIYIFVRTVLCYE